MFFVKSWTDVPKIVGTLTICGPNSTDSNRKHTVKPSIVSGFVYTYFAYGTSWKLIHLTP